MCFAWNEQSQQEAAGGAVEAAEGSEATAPSPAAMAPSPSAEGKVVEEAEGLRLHLSSNSNSGYKCVAYLGKSTASRPYCTKVQGGTRTLGTFATAVEAAVCYAKYVLSLQRNVVNGVVKATEGFATIAPSPAAEVVEAAVEDTAAEREEEEEEAAEAEEEEAVAEEETAAAALAAAEAGMAAAKARRAAAARAKAAAARKAADAAQRS